MPSFLGIDFYPSVTLASLHEILKRDYDYFVLDYGILNTYTFKEFCCANIQLAICTLSPWKLDSFDEFIHIFKENYKNYEDYITLIGNVGTKENYKKIHRSFPKEIIPLPFLPNPFQITSEAFSFFEKVVGRNISR